MGKKVKVICNYCQRRIYQNEPEIYHERTGWHLHVKCVERFVDWVQMILLIRRR